MKLALTEATRLLGLEAPALERLAREGRVPCQRLEGDYWFHRAELLEWATERGISVARDAFSESRRAHDHPLPEFARALAAGGIHHGVPAIDRESALRAVVERLPFEDASDRELLFAVLSARESAGSTGVGGGIAIPHARAPILLPVQEPSITLCFLERAVPFGAIDGLPVHTLFSLVTLTVRSHLHLLAGLAAALQDADFRSAVAERAPAPVILAEATRVSFAFRAPAGDAET